MARRPDLHPRDKGAKGAIERAQELLAQTPGAWMPQQFEIRKHYRPPTTAREILADFADDPIDVLITGVGTGGAHHRRCTSPATVLAGRQGLRRGRGAFARDR